MTCACGHEADEHEWRNGHPEGCEAEGCSCFYFEEDPDAERH